MSDIAIHCEGLSKKYQIGERERYKALRDTITDTLRMPFRALRSGLTGPDKSLANGNMFWALKDVSFDVKPGEVVGIIGRNGAGKSTLLKILSRITTPTSGGVDIRGRVGSLLEVGTGFHPELSGRENIHLNGAMLGMRRDEVRRKFDEIVDFAEVKKFLDTPVKRYSSGMYVRLAFAVAAHLEPEILVVDEVLAVGDAEFQKKCLGKMNSVAAKDGRTVLFVSHNMEAVIRLCNKAILLDKGAVVKSGDVNSTVTAYLKSGPAQHEIVDLQSARRTIPVRRQVRLKSARLANENLPASWKVPFGENIAFEVELESTKEAEDSDLAVALMSGRGFEVASCLSSHVLSKLRMAPGEYKYRVEYRNLRLVPGLYKFSLGVRSSYGFEDYIPEAFEVEVVPSEDSSLQEVDMFQGIIVPDVDFHFSKLDV